MSNTTDTPIRALIACGGTGGHLFPGIAIANGLRARGHEAAVIVSEKKIDEIAMRDYPDIPVFKLPAIASPPLFSPRIVPFALRFGQASWMARSIIKGFSPHAVVGMGGFTSMPVLVAGRALGLPALLHEANGIPGRANRLGERLASTMLVGWDAARLRLQHSDIRTVGTPIRQGLEQPQDLVKCGETFGLNPDKPILLVIGGSQGARGLNRLVTGSLSLLSKRLPDLQLLHLTGVDDLEEVKAAYQGSTLRHFVAAFCHDMEKAYPITNVVVARSGASTLNELATFGLPSILVPYPHAADLHQHANAEIFTDAGAALLADEDKTEPSDLVDHIVHLLEDRLAYAKMGDAMRDLAPDDSVDLICDAIEGEVAKKNA